MRRPNSLHQNSEPEGLQHAHTHRGRLVPLPAAGGVQPLPNTAAAAVAAATAAPPAAPAAGAAAAAAATAAAVVWREAAQRLHER